MERERSGRAVSYFRPERGSIARLGIAALVSAQCQAIALIALVPLAKTIAANRRHYSGSAGPLHFRASTGQLAIITATAIVLAAFIDAWIAWQRARVIARWEFSVRERIINDYFRADYPTQTTERLGTLATLTTYTAKGSSALASLIDGLEAMLSVALFVTAAIVLDYRAALIMVGGVAALSILLRPVMIRTRRYGRASAALLIDYGRAVTETTSTVRDARVFDALGPLSEELTRTSRQVAGLRRRSAFVMGVASPMYQYLGLLFIVGALGAASVLHNLDLAVFGGIMLLLLRSLTYGQQLQVAYQNILDCLPYAEKLDDASATYAAKPTKDGSVTLEQIHSLELEHVHYSYDGAVRALEDVSVRFVVGEIVGVVGPSGSGKSTLSQLLLRLRQPTQGAILVNRAPAEGYTLASWYRLVSHVPQDPHLLHASVHDNIAFLDASITREQVIAAAKAANIHEVIEGLADGYDTLVGPAYHDLSGGQVQRIGIARALARGTRVLVLDEPTSALDMHSEAVIQSTLESLRGHALVIVIAHRLSTLSICDRVLVLKDGRVDAIDTLAYISGRSEFFRRALDAGTLEIGSELRDRLPAEEP